MLENAKRWVNPINTSNKAKKIRRSMMAGLATFAVAVLLFAQIVLSADEAKMPAQESLYARSAALIDGDTGRLLYGKEEDVILPMASTTKIMTCILVLEMMEPEEICTASAYAASQPQVHLGVQKGWSFRCEDLLYSLMLESHNDTAVILAEAAAGSVEGFATWMNKKAKEIGLSQTHFVTPNGLDNEAHYTTARELALLLRYCIRTSPKSKEFLKITRTAQYEFTDTTGKYSFSVYNHNAFLQMMDGALSGKTGFTGNAGYCYVGALKCDDRTFIVALLACGWPNNKTYKWADTKKLMQYGISRFRKISLDEIELDAGEYVPVQVVDGQGTKIGEEVTTELEVAPVKENVELLIEKDQEVHIEYQLSRKLYAPVTEGDFIGEITYLLGDEVLAKRVVTVKNTVKRIDFCWCVKKTAELFPM